MPPDARPFFALLALTAAVAFWLAATRRLRRGTRDERLLDGLLLAAWLAVVLFWVLAGAGVFRVVPAALAVVSAAFLALALGGARDREPSEAESDHRSPWHSRDRQLSLLLGIVTTPWLAIAAARLLKALVAPPMAWDALTYHLAKAALWAQSGGLLLPPFPDAWSYYSWFPAGNEILLAWLMLPTRTDLLLGPYGLAMWAAVFLAGRRLAQLVGADAPIAWLAGLSLATLPCIASFAASGYADTPLLLFHLLGVTHAVAFLRGGEPRAALLAAAAAGLTAAVKISGLGLALVVLALLVIGLLRHRRPRRRLAAAVLVVALLPTVGYLRTWSVRGSPLYPLKIPFFASLPYDRDLDQLLSGRILEEHGAHSASLADLGALFWTGGRAHGHLNLGLGGLLLVLLGGAGVVRGLGQPRQRDIGGAAVVSALTTSASLLTKGVAALRTVWLGLIGRLVAPGLAPLLVAGALLPAGLALPGFAAASVLNLLHSRPLGYSATTSVAALAGLAVLALAGLIMTAVLVALANRQGRGLRVATAIVAAAVLLPLLSALRHTSRFEIWRQTGEGGAAFEGHGLEPVFPRLVPILEHLDDGTRKRLAVTAGWEARGHNWFLYPLLGRRLEHELLYVPITTSGKEDDLSPAERWQRRDENAWLERLAAAEVDYVVGLWPRPREWSWVEGNPERFEILGLDRHGSYLLARVR